MLCFIYRDIVDGRQIDDGFVRNGESFAPNGHSNRIIAPIQISLDGVASAEKIAHGRIRSDDGCLPAAAGAGCVRGGGRKPGDGRVPLQAGQRRTD